MSWSSEVSLRNAPPCHLWARRSSRRLIEFDKWAPKNAINFTKNILKIVLVSQARDAASSGSVNAKDEKIEMMTQWHNAWIINGILSSTFFSISQKKGGRKKDIERGQQLYIAQEQRMREEKGEGGNMRFYFFPPTCSSSAADKRTLHLQRNSCSSHFYFYSIPCCIVLYISIMYIFLYFHVYRRGR